MIAYAGMQRLKAAVCTARYACKTTMAAWWIRSNLIVNWENVTADYLIGFFVGYFWLFALQQTNNIVAVSKHN